MTTFNELNDLFRHICFHVVLHCVVRFTQLSVSIGQEEKNEGNFAFL